MPVDQLSIVVTSKQYGPESRLPAGYAAPVTMKAWLEGHTFDLEDLATLLPSGDVRVIRQGDGFYMSAEELDNPPSGKAFHEVAEELLVRANGLGRLMRPDFTPVGLTGRYEQEGDVSVVLATAAVAVAKARLSATAIVRNPDGTVQPQPPPATVAYIALAAHNHDVAEALEIMGRPQPLNFADLYKVYEIIEHSGHMKIAMTSAGFGKPAARLFARTANHPEASGQDARHARSNERPPAKPMTLDEARRMIRELVTAWMDSL
jgi:hypothetical protein